MEIDMHEHKRRSGKKPIDAPTCGVGARMKMSLDSYASFVESGDKSDYTVDFINLIIHLHGFSRIYKTPKKVLVEAVESIQMMNPSRSTLRENISSGPIIFCDEMNADVKCLDWFECSNCQVNSVQCLNVNSEAVTSKDLVLYKGDDVLIHSKRKSTGKLPAINSSPAKTKKRSTGRKQDYVFVYVC